MGATGSLERVTVQNKWIRWGLWGVFGSLILGGVIAKRFFDVPAWVPPMHIAALFVVIGISVTAEGERGAWDEDDDDDDEESDSSWDEV